MLVLSRAQGTGATVENSKSEMELVVSGTLG
jgi:hypothetical protein